MYNVCIRCMYNEMIVNQNIFAKYYSQSDANFFKSTSEKR